MEELERAENEKEKATLTLRNAEQCKTKRKLRLHLAAKA